MSTPSPLHDDTAALELLAKLVNTDSPTGGPGVMRMYEHLEPILADLGFVVEHIPTRGSVPVLRARRTAQNTARARVLMLGHVDTVFGEATSIERPFTVSGDRARGPGVADMKAGLVTMLAAISRLGPMVDELDLTVLLNADEEIGSPHSTQIIEATAPGHDVALVFEAARRTGAIVSSRRGIQRYRLDVTGRAAHSGTAPERGANALEQLAHVILGVRESGKDITGATVTAVLAQGGSKPNIVPDHASVELDCRFDDPAGQSRVHDVLSGLTGPGTVKDTMVRLVPLRGRPSFIRPSTDLANAYISAAGELGISVEAIAAGGGSDANLTAALGIPTLDGLGAVGGDAHTDQEYIEVRTLSERAEVCARLLTGLARRVENRAENVRSRQLGEASASVGLSAGEEPIRRRSSD